MINNTELNLILSITKKLTSIDGADSFLVRNRVLKDIMHLLKADLAHSFVWDYKKDAFTREVKDVTINWGAALVEDYINYWQFHNPFVPLTLHQRGATIIADVIPQKEFEKTEFFNNFLIKVGYYHGIHGCALDDGLEIGNVSIWRRKKQTRIYLKRTLAP